MADDFAEVYELFGFDTLEAAQDYLLEIKIKTEPRTKK